MQTSHYSAEFHSAASPNSMPPWLEIPLDAGRSGVARIEGSRNSRLKTRATTASHPAPSRRCALLSAVAVLALLSGCQTPVKTDFKPDTAFAAYRTYALMPLPQTAPANDPGLMLRLAKPAQEAVTDALTAKGFRPAERAQADFAVNLRGSSLPKVEVTDWGYTRTAYTRRYGRVPVHVGEVTVRNYDEKTLAIEIFDNKSHDLVWTGSMTKESSGKITPDKLQEAIRAILAKFPPTPGQPK